MEAWRSMKVTEQVELAQRVKHQVLDRLQKGNVRYQSMRLGFQGQPLEHLRQELLDALIYLEYLERQLEARESK